MSERVLIEARRLETDHQAMLKQIEADKAQNAQSYAQILELQRRVMKGMPLKAFEAYRAELEETVKAKE